MDQTQAERIINKQLQQNAAQSFQLLVLSDELEQLRAENEQLKAERQAADDGGTDAQQ